MKITWMCLNCVENFLLFFAGRLPFAPIKSPNPDENVPNEKKRKHSGSGASSSTPKTPRSETKDTDLSRSDENRRTPKGSSLVKEKSSEEEKAKEVSSKKRGRPPGSKNKSKTEGPESPQSDSSPVLKKRGRLSESGLNKSFDHSEGKDKKPADKEKSAGAKITEKESDSASGVDGDSESQAGNVDEKSSEESGEKKEKSTEDEDEPREQSKLEEKKRSRGRPKKSLTPQTPKDANSRLKKSGRPFGSKNKRDSLSSLNSSR